MADVSTTQTSQGDVPEFLKGYATDVLTSAKTAAGSPYAGQAGYYAATGDTPFAGFNPLQQQAFGEAATMGPSAQIGQASDMASNAGLASLNAGANYNAAATDPNAMQQWMSPYMQSVVDQQKQGAIRDYSRALPGLGFGGARAGGLGGSRSALVQSEAQRNLGNQLGNIQATGLQNAWDSANKNMQYGADLGLRGYGQANTAANTLGSLGGSDFAQRMAAMQNRGTMGTQIQNKEQEVAGSRFADWQAMMKDPQEKAKFMSGILGNIPVSGKSTPTPSSSSGDWMGLLTGLFSEWQKANPGAKP
jgi:hypothetical protein